MDTSHRSNSIAPFVATTPPQPKAKKNIMFRAWRPRPSFTALVAVIGSLGSLFFALGIVIIVYSNSLFEFETRYDSLCSLNANCTTEKFLISQVVSKPVYVQYRITEFYQNNLRYMRSSVEEQLRDGVLLDKSALEDCEPYLTNREMSKTISVLNTTLNPDEPAIPCGLAAYTFFNDTFDLVNLDSGKVYPISDKNIAWESDKQYKFNNIELSKQWIDMKNERFIIWMKIAPFENFIKTWGVINEDLPAGIYQFRVSNTWNNLIFGGQKFVILQQVLFFGGRNFFLGGVFVAVGGLSILVVIFLIIRKVTHRRTFHNFDTN